MPIIATDGAVLAHVPPPVAVSVVVLPVHSVSVPLMLHGGETVTILVV